MQGFPGVKRKERTENTVALDQHALGTLRYVRSAIDSAGVLAVPGIAGSVMGTIGLVAAVLTAIPVLAPHWLAIWTSAAALAFAAGATLLVRQSAVSRLNPLRGPAYRFFVSLTPALLAGALLTPVLVSAGVVHLVPGMWLILYGCAVISASVATASTITRQIQVMGVLFMALGLAATQLSPHWHNLLLGLGFGGLHAVFGLLIGRRAEQ